MHDWFCQIELIESIWQKKAELRESYINFQTKQIKNERRVHFSADMQPIGEHNRFYYEQSLM